MKHQTPSVSCTVWIVNAMSSIVSCPNRILWVFPFHLTLSLSCRVPLRPLCWICPQSTVDLLSLPSAPVSVCDFNGHTELLWCRKEPWRLFDDLRIPLSGFLCQWCGSAGFVSPWPPVCTNFGRQPSVKWSGWRLPPPSMKPVFYVTQRWIVPKGLQNGGTGPGFRTLKISRFGSQGYKRDLYCLCRCGV